MNRVINCQLPLKLDSLIFWDLNSKNIEKAASKRCFFHLPLFNENTAYLGLASWERAYERFLP